MLDEISYSRGHINAVTSTEFIRWLDEFLQTEGASRPWHQQSSFKHRVSSHTPWVHIDAATSAEFVQIPDEITHCLKVRHHNDIKRDPSMDWTRSRTRWGTSTTQHQRSSCKYARWDHILPVGTSAPSHQQSVFKCWMRSHTCWWDIRAWHQRSPFKC